MRHKQLHRGRGSYVPPAENDLRQRMRGKQALPNVRSEAHEEYSRKVRIRTKLKRFSKQIRNAWQKRRRWQKILLGGMVFIAMAGLLWGVSWQKRRQPTIREFYSQQLQALLEAIVDIGTTVKTSDHEENLESNLDTYADQLKSTELLCRQMDERQSTLPAQELTDQLKDALSNQEQLCQDLTAVTRYAADQAHALRPYLLLEPLNEASPDINYVLRVSNQTLKKLGRLDNSVVQDPALPELQTLLGRTVTLAEQTHAASGSPDKRNLVSDVNKSITDNRSHLLSARAYLWKNTIRIDAAARAIHKVKVQFESDK